MPRVAADAYVDQSAQIIGDVEIGAESSVWMNCVVRGDVHWIRIGRRTNIQDGTIVHVMRETHPTTINDNVTIGHAAVIHGCTIQDRVLVGMGAILLNGVEIGSDSIVAAGALLPEGMKVPPRSLVMGSPGKVRRPLTDDEVTSITWYADNYVRYRLEYVGAQGVPDSGAPDARSSARRGGTEGSEARGRRERPSRGSGRSPDE
jgi:carbonic anhydrase/acetyltransferase-like protein (isoleucine patch superfamily)